MVKRLSPLALTLPIALLSCDREERRFEEPAPLSQIRLASPSTPLYAGPEPPLPPEPRPAGEARYQENAWAIGQGARLYVWFGCAGCHAKGGGGMGPPLMDAEWRYGSEPDEVFASIVHGRPNGMPSFRGRIPDPQVWQLVAYVRSLSRLVPKDARPGRPNSLSGRRPPSIGEPAEPRPAEKK